MNEEQPQEYGALHLDFKNQLPNRVTLSQVQTKAWDETRTALLWSAPAFSHIMYTMMSEGGPTGAFFTDDKAIPIAGTDDKFLFLNPEKFFKYDLSQRVFIVAHEIVHAILNHCGQMQSYKSRELIRYSSGETLPYDDDTFMKAIDYIVNDLLIESRVGSFPPEGLHDKSIAVGNDSAPDVFRKLYEKRDDPNGGGGDDGKKGFDTHLAPGSGEGKNPTQAQQDRNETEWNTQVAAALNSAKAQGKLPAAMEEFFKALLEPQVDWTDRIETLLARKVGNSSYTWATLDRQLIVQGIGAPGRTGHGAGTLVVAIDTSGSISLREVETFFGEVRGILEDLRPKEIKILWADAAVHRVDDALDEMDLLTSMGKGIVGRGGTAFEPVFERVTEEGWEADALIYFTDGCGSFGPAPKYPVIWANISPKDSVKYPWGDVVDVPLHQSK